MSECLLIFTEHLPARRPFGAKEAKATATATPRLKLVLPFEQRQKARQRAHLTAGFEVGIQLPRGTVLRGGDRLQAADGTLLEIVAAREPVTTVWTRDLRQLALAAYHLGNRHVALEIGTGWVRYLRDHVLDDLVLKLGFAVVHGEEPFEPEAGAYGGGSHSHDLGHAHDRAHAVEHDLPHAHDHAHGHDHGVPHSHTLAFAPRRHGHDQ